MDLLRQVLVRLPLQRIMVLANYFEPWNSGSSLNQDYENFLFTRLRVVNRLSEDYLQNLRRECRDCLEAYLALSLLQGEMFDRSPNYLKADAIADRAIFIGDNETANRIISHMYDPTPIDINLALVNGDERIILPLLNNRNQRLFRIADPEIINWTPNVIQRYREFFDQTPPRLYTEAMAFLAGYLRFPIADLFRERALVVGYWKNYFLSTMRQVTDRFSELPELADAMERMKRLIHIGPNLVEKVCIYAGYFPSQLMENDPTLLRTLAAEYIQPELLERLPIGPFKIAIIRHARITHHLVLRSRRMISVIDRLYPEQRVYLTDMRIICGLPVDHVTSKQIPLMDALAHPQLTRNLLDPNPQTSVFYDLVNYVRQVKENPRRNDENVRRAYVQGKLLQSFGADEMRELREFAHFL